MRLSCKSKSWRASLDNLETKWSLWLLYTTLPYRKFNGVCGCFISHHSILNGRCISMCIKLTFDPPKYRSTSMSCREFAEALAHRKQVLETEIQQKLAEHYQNLQHKSRIEIEKEYFMWWKVYSYQSWLMVGWVLVVATVRTVINEPFPVFLCRRDAEPRCWIGKEKKPFHVIGVVNVKPFRNGVFIHERMLHVRRLPWINLCSRGTKTKKLTSRIKTTAVDRIVSCMHNVDAEKKAEMQRRMFFKSA